jgi:hypothetical protein
MPPPDTIALHPAPSRSHRGACADVRDSETGVHNRSTPRRPRV